MDNATVFVGIDERLLERLDAVSAEIGLTRNELIRRAIEAECTSTEELTAWREHEYGLPAVEMWHPTKESRHER